jgi:2',3'-cyclic-nucleotide 2'-phosphodiesterase (5'-nucleotidase family)
MKILPRVYAPVALAVLSAALLSLTASWARDPAAAPAPAPAKIEIEVLHTNDVHGYTRPHAAGNGGAGAVAARVAAARERARTDRAYDVVVVDCGDLFGGGAEDSFSKGKMMAEFATGVGYDVYVPGNHDFGYGLPPLLAMSKALREKGTAVLAVNIRKKDGGGQATHLCDGDTMITRKGIKIGVVGATTPGTERMNLDENVEGLEFTDPTSAIAERVQALRKAGATLVMLASHVGLDNGKYVDDKKIAHAVTDLDVIVGGHTHKLLDRPYVEPASKALIVQAGSQNRWMGSLTLAFDGRTGKPLDENGDGVVDHRYEVIEMSRQPGAHPLAAELKTRYWDPIQKELDARVGTADVGLYRKFYKTESILGSFLADAILEAAPGAQIAMSATSELRDDLRRGEVRVKDVFEVVPFDNEVVRCKVKGRLIRDVLDSVYGAGRRFVQVAGMTVKVDSRKPQGRRVIAVTVGGQPLSDTADYVLATTDFMAQGKGGFSQFNHRPPYEKTGVSNRDAMIARIRKLGTVTSAAVEMGRLEDAALMVEIGKVTRTFGTEMSSQAPNLFDIVAQSLLGRTPRGDLALIDSSGIHWKLSPRFPVVKRDLHELCPYDNQVVTAPITGKQLSEVFADIVKSQRRLSAWIAGGTLVVAGAEWQLLIGGAPLDPARTYTLVTYDHLLTGPRGFEKLGALRLTGAPVGVSMRDSLEAWVRAVTPIGPEDLPARPGVVIDQPVRRTVDRMMRFDSLPGGAGARGGAPEAAHEHD